MRDHSPSYTPAQDPYAAKRCVNCRHLRYADEQAGDPCRICDCMEHVTLEEINESFDAFERWYGRVRARLQDLGHLDCGGWSAKEQYDFVTCMCGVRVDIPEEVRDASPAS